MESTEELIYIQNKKEKLTYAKATEVIWPTFENDFVEVSSACHSASLLQNIYHTADIHIHPKNHHHVAFAWRAMIETIQALTPNFKRDSLLVIAGDLFDNKTWLKASDISLFMSMIDDLERLELRTFIIPGNHDFNGNQMQTNAQAQDDTKQNISDMSEDKILALLSKRPLRFVKHWSRSGVDYVDDVEFYFHSPIDGLTPRPSAKDRYRADGVKIITCAIAHEALRESGTCSGFSMEHAARFGVNDFSTVYDMNLFGDIHLAQRLARNVCFCGSLTQKTRAEGVTHGIVRWHIRKNFTPEFIPLRQLSVWIAIHVRNNELPVGLPDPILVTARGVQLFHSQCTSEFVREMETRLQRMYKQRKLDGVFDIARASTFRPIGAPTGRANDTKGTPIVVFTDDQITHLLGERLAGMHHIDADTRERIHALHKQQFNSSRFGQRLDWRIRFISFSNVYCFAGENHFNFDDLAHLSSLIGNNFTGKSSFFDVIILGIFNRCLRGTKADALHGQATSGYIKVVLTVGEDEYRIEHVWLMKSKVVVHVYKNGVNVSNATMTETNSYIEENIVGPLKVFENTVVALQERQFLINLSPTDRYTLISQIIELDGLKQAEKDNHTAILTLERMIKLQHKSGLNIDNTITKMRQDMETKKTSITQNRIDLERAKEKLKQASLQLDSLTALAYSQDREYTPVDVAQLRTQQQKAELSYPFQDGDKLTQINEMLIELRQKYDAAIVDQKAHELLLSEQQHSSNSNVKSDKQQQQQHIGGESDALNQLEDVNCELQTLRSKYGFTPSDVSSMQQAHTQDIADALSEQLASCKTNLTLELAKMATVKRETQEAQNRFQTSLEKHATLEKHLNDNLVLKSEYETKFDQIVMAMDKQQQLPGVLAQKLESVNTNVDSKWELPTLHLVISAHKQESEWMLQNTKKLLFASDSLIAPSTQSTPLFALLESLETRIETFCQLQTLISDLETANKQDLNQYQKAKEMITGWLQKFESIQQECHVLLNQGIPHALEHVTSCNAKLHDHETCVSVWKTKVAEAETKQDVHETTERALLRFRDLLSKQIRLKQCISLLPFQTKVKQLHAECASLEANVKQLMDARAAADSFEQLTKKLKHVTEATEARQLHNQLKLVDIPRFQTIVDQTSKRCMELDCEVVVLQNKIETHEAEALDIAGYTQELSDRRLYESLMNQKTGIANERMSSLCQEIELHSNRLLTQFTTFTLSVHFTGNIEMKITNTLTNTTVSAERLSTLQKFVVDIVLRCVICYLIPSGCPRMLLIDEGLGNADQEQLEIFCRKVLPVVAKEFDHVLIVSHFEAVHDFTSCSSHIEIQPDHTSRLRFGHKPEDAHKLKVLEEFENDRERIKQEKQARLFQGLPVHLPLKTEMVPHTVVAVSSDASSSSYCHACTKQFANASTLKRHEKSKQHIINVQIQSSIKSAQLKRKQI